MKGLFQCPPRATPWVLRIYIQKMPCKGKSFLISLKLLPLQGVLLNALFYPGCYPGLGASALSGRVGQIITGHVGRSL